MTAGSGANASHVLGRVSSPRRVAAAFTRRLGYHGSDLGRIVRFGPSAPRYAERLWVDPRRVWGNPFPKEEGFLKTDSGRVLTSSWPEINKTPRETDIRIEECLQHWAEGMSWEETGRLDRWAEIIRGEGVVYNCKTMEEVRERLAGWDRIFEKVRAERRIRSRSEMSPGNFRERGGIGIHVGPSGLVYKGRGGHHRFAMSLALDLSVIPAQVGVVHVSAIPALADLRKHPDEAN